MVLAGHGRNAIFIDEPRGTYTDAEIDEIKEEAKRTRRELDLLRRPEIESGSGSGGGGDDEPGGDEDAGGDEEI
ncbi:hypothetical protein Tco_0231285 [Tanacetum coccineum]